MYEYAHTCPDCGQQYVNVTSKPYKTARKNEFRKCKECRKRTRSSNPKNGELKTATENRGATLDAKIEPDGTYCANCKHWGASAGVPMNAHWQGCSKGWTSKDSEGEASEPQEGLTYFMDDCPDWTEDAA